MSPCKSHVNEPAERGLARHKAPPLSFTDGQAAWWALGIMGGWTIRLGPGGNGDPHNMRAPTPASWGPGTEARPVLLLSVLCILPQGRRGTKRESRTVRNQRSALLEKLAGNGSLLYASLCFIHLKGHEGLPSVGQHPAILSLLGENTAFSSLCCLKPFNSSLYLQTRWAPMS